MGSHPINLAVRFMLELAALLAVGLWGWKLTDGWLHFVLALGIPIVIGTIWGIFAVPNDPSRSGLAPVPIPGVIRLVIELSIFCFAAWTLQEIGHTMISFVFGGIVTIHYLLSYDRILWLIRNKSN